MARPFGHAAPRVRHFRVFLRRDASRTGNKADSLLFLAERTSTAIPDSTTAGLLGVSTKVEFDAVVRIDTPGEADYYRNGGILQTVLRKMARGEM